jgi:hypothetical protein
MAYTALILHHDEADWAAEVRNAIRDHSQTAWLDPDLVACASELPDELSGPAVALYLATSRARDHAELQATVGAALEAGIIVVPVIRPGADFHASVPDALSPINAIPWDVAGHDVAEYVLSALGIADFERQVFVSYRRSDAAPIAEALWHRLSERRFDVFLDRFSVPPGADFQARLRAELSDKAFAVIIESPDAAGSPWVEYEVAYAFSHSIGVRALTVPGTLPRQLFRVVPEPFRIRLADTDVEMTTGSPRKLADAALNRVVYAIETAHEEVLARRREQLLLGARDELRGAGWSVREVAQWTLLASGQSGAQLVRVTPRAPRPTDLWQLDRERTRLARAGVIDSSVTGRLVHASADIEPDSVALIEWIGDTRGLSSTMLARLPAALHDGNGADELD